jgi:hypothetical protein
MELGATLPRLMVLPHGFEPKTKAAFPSTNAIHSPSGDHARECAPVEAAILLGAPPSSERV